MLGILDEERNIDMATKFKLGQNVCITSYQGYRKGTVTGITVKANDKGVVVIYTIELYMGKKQEPKVKKCLEKNVFNTPSEALAVLAAAAAKDETNNSNPENNK